MRYRITVRGENIELRGYLVAIQHDTLNVFANVMEPFGIVVASAADDTYDPFKEQDARELHHFETEQENARLAAQLREASQIADDLEGNWEQGDLAGAVNRAVAFLREASQVVEKQ